MLVWPLGGLGPRPGCFVVQLTSACTHVTRGAARGRSPALFPALAYADEATASPACFRAMCRHCNRAPRCRRCQWCRGAAWWASSLCTASSAPASEEALRLEGVQGPDSDMTAPADAKTALSGVSAGDAALKPLRWLPLAIHSHILLLGICILRGEPFLCLPVAPAMNGFLPFFTLNSFMLSHALTAFVPRLRALVHCSCLTRVFLGLGARQLGWRRFC